MVVIETGPRGSQQISRFEIQRGEGDRTETLKTALRQLLHDHPAKTDNIAVALPGSTLALHVITLPFGDPKRIEATLPFELEGQLPFDLSEAIYDYQIGGRRETKTEVLAGVVRTEEMTALLAMLTDAGVDPRVVTHPALGFQSLLLGLPPSPTSEPVAIIDVGHERTSIAVGYAGAGVEWARTFVGGGRDLSRALATELACDLQAANDWKEAHGVIGEQAVGPDAERASAAFQRALQSIVREIRATLKAYAAQSRIPVGKILLCGGTAQLTGLPQYLARELSTPVELLELPEELKVNSNELSDEPEQAHHPASAAAQAYSLAARGILPAARVPRFNLRRGAFAFRRDADSARDQLLRLGMFAGVLLALLFVFLITRNTLLGRREREVDQQLCVVTESVLHRCEPNYDRALNLLKGKESPTAEIPRRSAVNLLSELSDHIPDDLNVKFNQMDIDLERVTLKGEVDTPRQIDVLEHALKNSACFKEVQEGKIEKATKGSGVSFRLEVQVQCPGEEVAHEQQ
jgi:general secretion pathway protein L